MIFYYSATGNTRYAAHTASIMLGEDVYDIIKDSKRLPDVSGEKMLGFLFPIYCWGIPPVMRAFIEKLLSEIPADTYVWAICTCGDEAGIAMRQFNKLSEKKRGRGADAVFSLIMPNTYVLLPGFDVDSPEIEKTKLKNAPERLKKIISVIQSGSTGIFDVHEGSLPSLRTRLLYPLFVRYGVFTKYWHVSDKCISCGKCKAICPAENIDLQNGKPVWGNTCYSCCSCFHICPEKAISYGSVTKNKSQYICPLR